MSDVIEILMAARNGENYIREQIDSIIAQTDPGWRLTVSDDASDDATVRIVEGYAARFQDKIALQCSGRRFGNARDHFFYLMDRCDADWMLFCDHDDVWYPGKVARMRAAMNSATETYGADTPILVFSDQTPTDANLTPLALSLMRYQKQYFEAFDYRSILMQNVVTGGAMGINRALARLAGRREDADGIIMHDWWLAATAARFGRIVYIDEPLGVYRQHGGNAVGAKDVGSAGYVASKLSGLKEVRRAILRKKAQAAVFERAYGDALDEGDLAFLHAFERARSGPLFWLRYQGLIHGAARKAGMLALC